MVGNIYTDLVLNSLKVSARWVQKWPTLDTVTFSLGVRRATVLSLDDKALKPGYFASKCSNKVTRLERKRGSGHSHR